MRGAWIEIALRGWTENPQRCRSPCGERGLKSRDPVFAVQKGCRSPCGERGLKFKIAFRFYATDGRSPCGERGLKSFWYAIRASVLLSLPVRGAWIEI